MTVSLDGTLDRSTVLFATVATNANELIVVGVRQSTLDAKNSFVDVLGIGDMVQTELTCVGGLSVAACPETRIWKNTKRLPRTRANSMDKSKRRLFAELARRHAAGDRTAQQALSSLRLSLEDDYCLWNLHQEWEGAFSYMPGRSEALNPIASLAARIADFASDVTLAMFQTEEWSRLVALRGPCEVVQLCLCRACGFSFTSIGTSGFYDAAALVCSSCGDVFFKSFYDETPTLRCSCGGVYM